MHFFTGESGVNIAGLRVLPAAVLLAFLFVAVASRASAADSAEHDIVNRNLQVGHLERNYLVYLPRRKLPTYPVVFVFHGGFGNAESVVRQSELDDLQRAAGHVLVYPNGFRRSWNVGPCCGPAKTHDIDELAFFDAMLNDLKKLTTVDAARVYATGFSNGAMLTYHLACHRSEKLAAVVPVSGTMRGELSACRPSRAVPLLHLHGAEDEWAPINGGYGKRKKAGKLRPMGEVIDFWGKTYQCTEKNQIVLRNISGCSRFSKCLTGSTVTFCAIEGLGHQWPGHSPQRRMVERMLGTPRPEVEGSEVILDFFETWHLNKSSD